LGEKQKQRRGILRAEKQEGTRLKQEEKDEVKNRDKQIWKEGEGKEKYWKKERKTERKKQKIEEENRGERTKQK
jgi:hypothetical protein